VECVSIEFTPSEADRFSGMKMKMKRNDLQHSAVSVHRSARRPAFERGARIRGTRVPVELLLRKLAEGASDKELLEDYPHITGQTGTA